MPILEIFRNLREYYDQLYAQKFENLMKQKISRKMQLPVFESRMDN